MHKNVHDVDAILDVKEDLQLILCSHVGHNYDFERKSTVHVIIHVIDMIDHMSHDNNNM